jgi:hypothetical protein
MTEVQNPVVIVGAPVQQAMGMAGGDIFGGATSLFIKQEMAAVELCGIEAKQRYRISVPDNGKEGSVFLYITEESECCERICCGPNRALTLQVHQGPSKEGPIIQTMHKPFACVGCCFLRPSFDVKDQAGTAIGHIDDPFRCCVMDQQVQDAKGQLLFTTSGTVCQAGMCCPCCSDVNFDIQKNGTNTAGIEKKALDCEDICLKTNRFIVNFDKITDPTEKRMLLSAAMLLDLEYFEQQK